MSIRECVCKGLCVGRRMCVMCVLECVCIRKCVQGILCKGICVREWVNVYKGMCV